VNIQKEFRVEILE